MSAHERRGSTSQTFSQYRAVLPVNGADANLTAYKNAGGTVLATGSQLSQYAPAYASLASSGTLQIVPAVAAAGTSAQLQLANVTSGTACDETVTFAPAGLGLADGTYHVVKRSGNTVSSSRSFPASRVLSRPGARCR